MRINDKDLTPRQDQGVHRCIYAARVFLANDLVNEMEMPVCRAYRSAYHAVGLSVLNQHGTDQRRAPPHLKLCKLPADTLANHELVVCIREVTVALVRIGIH